MRGSQQAGSALGADRRCSGSGRPGAPPCDHPQAHSTLRLHRATARRTAAREQAAATAVGTQWVSVKREIGRPRAPLRATPWRETGGSDAAKTASRRPPPHAFASLPFPSPLPFPFLSFPSFAFLALSMFPVTIQLYKHGIQGISFNWRRGVEKKNE